jgi:cytochrome c oxidase subunit 3
MAVTVREVAPPPPRVPEEPPRRDRGPEDRPWTPRPAVRLGIWLLVGAIAMFFVALTSALMTRRAGADWAGIAAPRILWASTAAILASSLALESARRSLRQGRFGTFRRGFRISALLGGLFLACQLLAWRALVSQGVYLSTNPHASYFYLLTAAHAAHLLGGLIWFGVLLGAATRLRRLVDRVDDFALYWHFLALLWVYLFAVLFA